MDAERLVALVGYALTLIWLVQVMALAGRVMSLVGFRQAFQTTGKVAPKDASGKRLELPEAALPFAGALAEMGFRRVGETQTMFPNQNDPVTAWIFVSADGETTVEISAMGRRVLALFVTLFGEDACVETAHPTGVTVKQEGYHARVITEGMDEAYDSHRARVAAWHETYGEPNVIASMEDFLAADAAYNADFARRKLMRLRPPVVVRVISSAYASLVLLGGMLIYWLRLPEPRSLLVPLALLLIPAMLADFVLWVWVRIADR